MLNSQKNMSSPEDIERAERLREVFEALYEVNKRFPVIVEGKRCACAQETRIDRRDNNPPQRQKSL
jgi:hypothetical protein